MLALGALALGVTGCGAPKKDTPKKPEAPQASPDDRALSIDGVTFKRGEIDAFAAYFRRLDPSVGKNKTIREILDQDLIPSAFVRRRMPLPYAQQKSIADELARSVSQAGYDDLVEKAQRIPGYEVQKGVIRQHLTVAEQQWLFDDLKVGAVSPVLKSPLGYSIVSANRKTPGPTTAYDQVDVCLVRFHAQTKKEFLAWYQSLRSELSTKPATAHPDYRDAIPPWLKNLTFER